MPSDLRSAPPSATAWRNPLVWLVFGIPAATVLAGLFTLWVAVQRADPPVADRFEKRGLAVSLPSSGEAAAAKAPTAAAGTPASPGRP